MLQVELSEEKEVRGEFPATITGAREMFVCPIKLRRTLRQEKCG